MAATATKRLEALRQAEVKARQRGREIELAANAARTDADRARSTLVEAHAEGDARAIKVAEKERVTAVDCAEGAAISAEGAEMRAERAGQERTRYEAANSRELISELEPAGAEAAERLQQAAADLLAADAAWFATRQVVADLLSTTPGASAANDLADGHALTEIARLLRRTNIEVAPPLPHWQGERERERQHREQDA